MSLWFYLAADVGGPELVTVFEKNITHNLIPMWTSAGAYDALYTRTGMPAGSVVQELTNAVESLKADPARFRALDAPNCWGTYEDALPWLEEVLAACKRMPAARIGVSR